MKFNKLFLFFGMIVFSLTFISGLQVTNSTVLVEKISGINTQFFVDITNNNNYDFFNLSFSPVFGLSFPVISSISPGATVRADIMINRNENFKDLIKVRGFYNAPLGASNQTHNIDIDFYAGLTKCSFTAIKGDKITWKNLVNDDIIMRNSITGIDVTTITKNGTYETIFSDPTIFTYYLIRRGYIFTAPCTITVLNDVGLINNPEYDGNFTLDLKIIFLPTNISRTFMIKNYTIPVFQSQDGLFSISNTGNNTAKNIQLSGEWFKFSTNNFDLDIGQTKVVSYTISPIVTNSSETRINYTKRLTISGNFNSVFEDFNIYIPYSNLSTSGPTSNYQSLIDVIAQYCLIHPAESFCIKEPQTVYIYNNNGSGTFNVTYSEEQVKGMWDYMFKIGDDMSVNNNYNKEKFDKLESQMTTIDTNVAATKTEIENLKNTQSDSTSLTIVIVGVVIGIIIISLLLFIVFFIYRKKQKENLERI